MKQQSDHRLNGDSDQTQIKTAVWSRFEWSLRSKTAVWPGSKWRLRSNSDQTAVRPPSKWGFRSNSNQNQQSDQGLNGVSDQKQQSGRVLSGHTVMPRLKKWVTFWFWNARKEKKIVPRILLSGFIEIVLSQSNCTQYKWIWAYLVGIIVFWYLPSGYNVGSRSMQSHDVASTLRRRCINVMTCWAFHLCFIDNIVFFLFVSEFTQMLLSNWSTICHIVFHRFTKIYRIYQDVTIEQEQHAISFLRYCICPKYGDWHAWANGVDSDQTPH